MDKIDSWLDPFNLVHGTKFRFQTKLKQFTARLAQLVYHPCRKKITTYEIMSGKFVDKRIAYLFTFFLSEKDFINLWKDYKD